MTFDEYQKQALKTAYTSDKNNKSLMAKTIWAMGVAGEAGEVIEKWKKIVAYKDGEITPEDKTELGKELGDVVWYIAVLADSLDLSFDDLMQKNVDKLKSRQQRGTIKGQGDNR
jgi:NTP pyrophosphatase (non-canonical NTP hydrolase)